MQNAPIAHVIDLLHILAITATNHARAVNLWQLQCRLALVANQAHVVGVLLSSQMGLVPVLVY